MRKNLARLLTVFVSTILLAACADPQAFLPKPYRPMDKGQNRMAQMILPDHIVVPVVRGLDDETGALLARAVIDDFLKKEMIATTTRPDWKTSSLYGEFVIGVDGTQSIRWTFRDPYGATLEDFEIPATGSLTDLDTASLSARLLAKDMASAVTERILASRQSEPEPRLASLPTSLVDNIGGGEKIIFTAAFDAPGDGAYFLRKEIARSLAQAGFVVPQRPDEETYRLQCTIGVTESRPGFERLALTWELKSPQGTVLATIDQANEIPASSLKNGWADLAPLVTQGAATGIAAFFQKSREGF